MTSRWIQCLMMELVDLMTSRDDLYVVISNVNNRWYNTSS